MAKTGLDKDLKRIGRAQSATRETAMRFGPVGLAALFLAAVWLVTSLQTEGIHGNFLIIAAVIGGYMALNIGANDVANNVGPAVGSKALTLTGALIIAAIFEAAGAILAGGDVVSTISKGIIDPMAMPSTEHFIRAMISALLAAGIWLHMATYIGAPVSTTHSIVGGVLGAGIASVDVNVVNWMTMGKIAASWVISPVLGGLIAALFLAFIKSRIIYQEDKIAAAKKWVPVLVAIMVTAFTVYMMVKGLKRLWEPEAELIVICALVAFAVSYFILRPVIARAAFGLENRRASVAELFTYPLIFAACLLSFAHGANDVANAVGPLAAIVTAITTGGIAAKAEVPFWVMGVGAIGISLGLALFGPKLIRTVGAEITRLDRARAFCVALSAAITVIAASALGLPVSSTHIAVGAIFGVGFLREFRSNRTNNNVQSNTSPEPLSKKKQRKAKKRKLVRRQHLITIISAWLITVPAAAALAMAFCLGLDYFMQHSG